MGRFATVFVLILLTSAPCWSDTITLVADEWCPYNCAPGDRPGFMVEAAREALETAGHRVEYRVVPWQRAKDGLLDGTYDAVVGMTRNATTEARGYVFPDGPFTESRWCFYTAPRSTWTYEGVFSLEAVTLGVIRGYGYGEAGTPLDTYLKANTHTGRVEAVSGPKPLQQIVDMVGRGRIDAAIADRWVMGHLLTRHPPETPLREAGCLETADRVSIAFSPENPRSAAYARSLSEGLRRLRRSGRYDQISRRYVGP